MNIFKLVINEIIHRKVNFIFYLIIMGISVATVLATRTTLKLHDLQTETIIQQKSDEIDNRLAKLQDDYRKITLELGYNLLILPKGQNLANFYAQDFASKYMPESSTDILAKSKTLTVQHLLPSLTQKVIWPEFKQSVILIGVKGEVPYLYRNPKKPMLQPVPKGGMVVGYELQQSLDLKIGDKVKFKGEEFTISECKPRMGSKDDATIWITLDKAQELLNKQGKINAILALKCHCASGTLETIVEQVQKLLPDTQILQKNKEVEIRAKTRDRAKKEAKLTLATERKNRQLLKNNLLSFSSTLNSAIVLIAIFLVIINTLINVKACHEEIGILLTIGVSQFKIMAIFILKNLIVAIIAAIIGYFVGVTVAIKMRDTGAISDIISLTELTITIAGTIAFTLAASWVPTYLASQHDPASTIRKV